MEDKALVRGVLSSIKSERVIEPGKNMGLPAAWLLWTSQNWESKKENIV